MRHVPIVRPQHPTAVQLLPGLNDILNSGTVTNNGPYVQKFEAALTDLLGVPTIVFSSGMAALVAMLRATGVVGVDVICPSFTFPATPHAIVLAGGRPKFVDVDPINLCLDNDAISSVEAGAVLGVDPYGICWQPPPNLAIPVLIDAAPSFGSMVADDPPVQRGLAQVFSFHATKPFSTMEGGALCTDDAEFLEIARRIRNFGQDASGDCPDIGFNGKMLEICALIGLKQLEDWQHRSYRRTELAVVLGAEMRRFTGLRAPAAPAGQAPIWTYRPVFVEPEFGVSRDEVIKGLHDRGIGARAYYCACHKLSCYADGTSLPVTERLAASVIALPVYDDMTDRDIAAIVNAFKEIRDEHH